MIAQGFIKAALVNTREEITHVKHKKTEQKKQIKEKEIKVFRYLNKSLLFEYEIPKFELW